MIILLSMSFLLVALEKKADDILPLSGLLAVMAMGTVIFSRYAVLAKRLSAKFTKLRVGAEFLHALMPDYGSKSHFPPPLRK